jgi:hypothetical protein
MCGIQYPCILKAKIVFATFHPRNRTHRQRPRAFVAVAIVCVILLALVSVVQVAHSHQGVSDSDHCPICLMIHAAAPVLTAVALIALVQIATTAPVLVPQTVTRPWHAQLFTRPPPTRR